MSATVSAANIKAAMKAFITAITVDGGVITNDAALQALADSIANEINATIVTQYLAHQHAAGAIVDSYSSPCTGLTATTTAT
jgi:glycerol kinase